MTLGRECGITESQIMDFERGLPVYRLHALHHAALRSHDLWTVTPAPPLSQQLQLLTLHANSLGSSDLLGDDEEW